MDESEVPNMARPAQFLAPLQEISGFEQPTRSGRAFCLETHRVDNLCPLTINASARGRGWVCWSAAQIAGNGIWGPRSIRREKRSGQDPGGLVMFVREIKDGKFGNPPHFRKDRVIWRKQ
jgi:hypothetical protein